MYSLNIYIRKLKLYCKSLNLGFLGLERFSKTSTEPIRFLHNILPKMPSEGKEWKPSRIGCKTIALIGLKRTFTDFMTWLVSTVCPKLLQTGIKSPYSGLNKFKQFDKLIIVIYNFEIVVREDGFL